MKKDIAIEVIAYTIVGILILVIAAIFSSFSNIEGGPPPPPPPYTTSTFKLSSPMEIQFIADYTYKVTVEATDFCSAEVWWKKIDGDRILGSQKYEGFDKKTHSFDIVDLPRNDSLYIGATLVQEHEENTKTVRTYQAGTFFRTDNFHIIEVLNVEEHQVRVIATKENRIMVHGGKTATAVVDSIAFAGNPTEVSPGVWRHTLTLPVGYTHWSASLTNSDNHSIYTGIIEYK